MANHVFEKTYKEFDSCEEVSKFIDNLSTDIDDYGVRLDILYWRQTSQKHWFLSLRIENNTSQLEESPINIEKRNNFICYSYKEKNKTVSLIVSSKRRIDTKLVLLENKLYHLTHGPKALSIPDAFKVLSL